MKITRDLVLQIAAWATEIAGGRIELGGEHVHPDGDGGPSWFGGSNEDEFAGGNRHWNAIAFYGEAGLEYAAQANLPVSALPDWVCDILDHVAAGGPKRTSVRRAATAGERHGAGVFRSVGRARLSLVA